MSGIILIKRIIEEDTKRYNMTGIINIFIKTSSCIKGWWSHPTLVLFLFKRVENENNILLYKDNGIQMERMVLRWIFERGKLKRKKSSHIIMMDIISSNKRGTGKRKKEGGKVPLFFPYVPVYLCFEWLDIFSNPTFMSSHDNNCNHERKWARGIKRRTQSIEVRWHRVAWGRRSEGETYPNNHHIIRTI